LELDSEDEDHASTKETQADSWNFGDTVRASPGVKVADAIAAANTKVDPPSTPSTPTNRTNAPAASTPIAIPPTPAPVAQPSLLTNIDVRITPSTPPVPHKICMIKSLFSSFSSSFFF